MNLRHSAALALVGWYLLAPPVYKVGDSYDEILKKSYVNLRVPLSEWTNSGAFDSAADCEREKENRQKMDSPPCPDKNSLGALGKAICESNGQMVCIATDDPRLK